jgi:hypothetical protein
MSRARALLVLAFVIGACRALPSALPLADTGEARATEDGALGRNRVPLAERKGISSDDDDSSDEDEDTIEIVAKTSDLADAGASEAGAATDAGDAGDAGVRWAGEYFGSDRHVLRASGEQEKVELDDKAHTRVEEPAPGAAVISLVSSSDGQVICALRAKIKGNDAELEAGAACPGLFLMPPLAVDGSAKLDGDRLEVDLEGHGEFPSGNDTVEMDVEYHFEGKRR